MWIMSYNGFDIYHKYKNLKSMYLNVFPFKHLYLGLNVYAVSKEVFWFTSLLALVRVNKPRNEF